MLKLVNVFEMDYNAIVYYRLSFIRNYREMSFSLYNARYGNEKPYYDYLIQNGIRNIYFLVDDNNSNYILGDCYLDAYLDYHIDVLDRGAISYAVRPNERNKGYGTKMLELLLEKCKELEMEEVCVSCHANNIYSKKIIENNGGILEKSFNDLNLIGLKYWIKLEKEKVYKE